MAGVRTQKLTVRFPSAPERYDQLGEAVFRNDLERLLDELNSSLSALRKEIEDEVAAPPYPTVTGTREFRLVAADLLGQYADGADVTSWIDRWGGYDFVGGATNPQFNVNIFGDLPAVQFDGATDRLTVDRGPSASPGAYTWFFVIKAPAAWPAVNNTILQMSDAAGTGAFMSLVGERESSGFVGYWDATATWLESDDVIAVDAIHVLSYVSDDANIDYKRDQAVIEELGNPTLQSMERFNLGNNAAEGEQFGGYIAEAIMYSTALSAVDVVAVEEYLRRIYGTP